MTHIEKLQKRPDKPVKELKEKSKRGVPGPEKDPNIKSEMRYSEKLGKMVEYRRYFVRYDVNGEPQYQWRNKEEQRLSDLRAKRLKYIDGLVASGEMNLDGLHPDLTPKNGARARFIRHAWSIYAQETERPDTNVNRRFAEAVARALEDGAMESVILSAARLAAYLEPANRDPYDVRRAIDCIQHGRSFMTARQAAVLGEERKPFDKDETFGVRKNRRLELTDDDVRKIFQEK